MPLSKLWVFLTARLNNACNLDAVRLAIRVHTYAGEVEEAYEGLCPLGFDPCVARRKHRGGANECHVSEPLAFVGERVCRGNLGCYLGTQFVGGG